jgi:predicted RNA binding protein with dsRBD fold (UPF0201 family)
MFDGPVRVLLRAEVSRSEDPDKVLAAARNILGDSPHELERRPDAILLKSSGLSCLQKIHDQLRDRHVRNAARRLLLKSVEGTHMRILFNRQAAYVGVIAAVSAAEESPLGPVVLELDVNDPLKLLDWLVPYQSAEPQGQARP